ncbi:unnamed protein product [Kuraishia capsulata CBS 1993]|uniref:Major facilitator superfamily (MFS) profile domain-containing protein n=1 Tax=Kuraishia capsulata CBS 1993 TaxID=1382522 RepID=W6MJQ3_9ASCO|nr:uncharacterized protein KUCA_T00000698001 [Kuraishia capsulata CBS 1993]CDK24732.1 unnamed protein product [Kuraishia capsulata CBS 1993]
MTQDNHQEDEQPTETTPLVAAKSVAVWTVVPALWTGSFMCAVDGTIVSTTMARIASSMDGSAHVSWIATSYLLTNAAFQPLYGKASDIFGRRTMLCFAQLTFTLGCLACCLATSVPQFCFARALAGVGGGGLAALSSIIVSDIVPLHSRGIFQGYANLMFGVGQMLGGPIGGLCVETIGWRYMFGLQVIPMAVAALLCVRNVPYFFDDPNRRPGFSRKNFARVDLAGSATLAALVTALMLLFSGKGSLGLLTICILLGALFVFIESRVSEQVVPMRFFRGTLRTTALIAMFGSMTIYACYFVLPLYLQLIHGMTPAQSGNFNAVGVISLSLGSLLGGALLRTDPSKAHAVIIRANIVSMLSTALLIFGSAINLIAISGFAPTIEPRVNWAVLGVLGVGYSVTGLGYGAFLVSLLVTVVAVVGSKDQAVATGMNYVFRSIGSVMGVGMTLNVYTALLTTSLTSYFADVEGGKLLLQKLLADATFVRNLDMHYRPDVLAIFDHSLKMSQGLVVLFAIIACVFGISLGLMKRHKVQS